jgi:hypothetical protein
LFKSCTSICFCSDSIFSLHFFLHVLQLCCLDVHVVAEMEALVDGLFASSVCIPCICAKSLYMW